MSLAASSVSETVTRTVGLEALDAFSRIALAAAGADQPTADAATRAMLHGSRLGIDSHGIRLLDHYVSVLVGGRVNSRPRLAFTQSFPAIGRLDADHGHGALAAYEAMDHAIGIAQKTGLGAVSIQNSSHFGPAGAFAVEAARQGLIGLAFCNSDSFVRLHDGAERFHGTNPIALAVPVPDAEPWLLDMATSAIPYNRIKLYRSLGRDLPAATASDGGGRDTQDAEAAAMLAPLGGEFGFKGAGLAGLVEIFSAILSGMKLSTELLPMSGPDRSTPRQMGAFVMAIRTDCVTDGATFEDGMRRYLAALRGSATREGGTVMAPGDREWATAAQREKNGVPIDPETEAAFVALARRYDIILPFEVEASR